MLKPGSWQNPVVQVEAATGDHPKLLQCTVGEAYLQLLDDELLDEQGWTLENLADISPRDAFKALDGLLVNRFIDTREDGWRIGSALEDGEMAFAGLNCYFEAERAPNPDFEAVEVIISTWKRSGLLDLFRGTKTVSHEVLRFSVEPVPDEHRTQSPSEH